MVSMKVPTLHSIVLLSYLICLVSVSLALQQDNQPKLSSDAANENAVNLTSKLKLAELRDGDSSEGRNRKRSGILRKIALPLLLLMGLKTGISVPLIFGTVALAAFKGLWSGLTSLVVTAALALRGLLPPPRIIQLPPPPSAHHAHITDYYTDYKRADDLYNKVDDYNRYGW